MKASRLWAVLLVSLFWDSTAHALSVVQVFDFDFVLDSETEDQFGYTQLSGMDSGFYSQSAVDLLTATLTLDITISGFVDLQCLRCGRLCLMGNRSHAER